MADGKFQALREVYANWERIRSDRYQACVRLTRVICEGFRIFIDAPKEYPSFSMDTQNRKNEPYTFLATVSPLDEENLYHFDKTPSPFDALAHDEKDETLAFGIGLTVDRDTNTFPKTIMWYRISVRFEHGECKVRLYNREWFGFPEDQAASLGNDQLQPLYEQMLGFAMDAYSRDPWERPKTGGPIGFLAR